MLREEISAQQDILIPRKRRGVFRSVILLKKPDRTVFRTQTGFPVPNRQACCLQQNPLGINPGSWLSGGVFRSLFRNPALTDDRVVSSGIKKRFRIEDSTVKPELERQSNSENESLGKLNTGVLWVDFPVIASHPKTLAMKNDHIKPLVVGRAHGLE